MNYIYWLSQIQYSEQSLVGDKLFILSQLLQHEYPVTPGFVVGSNLWRQLIEHYRDRLIKEDFGDDYQLLQSIASHNRQIISDAVLPETTQESLIEAGQQLSASCLILQPVITNPWGKFDQFNGIWRSHTCNQHPQGIITAVKSVYSELFTASSLVYWHQLGLTVEQIELAILVRPLNPVLAAGTVEVSQDAIQIKASWGLVESLLQGAVEPDTYLVEPETNYVLTQHLGYKNYGYRPQDQSSATPANDCLEAYIPEEDLAATYVLDNTAIADLGQLIQNIRKQYSQLKFFLWTVEESGTTSLANFCVTGFDDHLETVSLTSDHTVTDSSILSSVPPLLTGIKASPGQVQAKVAVVADWTNQTEVIPAGSILVTKIIAPQHISLIRQTAGIITEMGGKTSHAAIIARELNIPAIVAATNATQILHQGDLIYLNGNQGQVYPPKSTQKLVSHHTLKQPIPLNYPIATKLMVNLSQPESIAATANLPVDGVGLLRSELMLADVLASQTLAKWQDSFRSQLLLTLTANLRQFAAAFNPRPVFYRSLDLYDGDLLDSVLGNRGTYHYLLNPSLFDLEIEALKTLITEGHTNLRLILPFVRSVEEFKFCLHRLEHAGLTSINSFQVWIMAEVPSVIMLLPDYIAAGVQGIAIGTNDLTQLLLGVNREQTQFSDRGLNANHSAMHKAMAMLLTTAREHNIDCCICGQAPVEHPDLIERLIQWGVGSISVEPDAVAQTYRAIARAERRLLLGKIR